MPALPPVTSGVYICARMPAVPPTCTRETSCTVNFDFMTRRAATLRACAKTARRRAPPAAGDAARLLLSCDFAFTSAVCRIRPSTLRSSPFVARFRIAMTASAAPLRDSLPLLPLPPSTDSPVSTPHLRALLLRLQHVRAHTQIDAHLARSLHPALVTVSLAPVHDHTTVCSSVGCLPPALERLSHAACQAVVYPLDSIWCSLNSALAYVHKQIVVNSSCFGY